jgi:hypothetical protein
MTLDVVEGEVREIPPERAIVAAQPGQAIVATADDPAGMVAVASRLATVLSDIVEKKRLYATIRGKKYPQVEAWMTIARLDNVVAREPVAPTRHDDGSYEAFAELVRLSDGMVIGSSSALCGTKDDAPWHERSEPARRSMAQTRATSRAFRQQYSWIMALAGYEPTPAEEMPHDREERPETPAEPVGPREGSLIGVIQVGKAPADLELRESPDGPVIAFRLAEGRKSWKVIARGPLAFEIHANRDDLLGQRASCFGSIAQESWTPPGKSAPVVFDVLTMDRMTVGALVLPTTSAPVDEEGPEQPAQPEAPSGAREPVEAPVEASGNATRLAGGSRPDASAAPCGAESPFDPDDRCQAQKGHQGKHVSFAGLGTSWPAR